MTLSQEVAPLLRGAVPDLASPALVRLVNHELRTPLAVVVGHLELLGDRASELPTDVRWSVHALEQAVQRLGSAVLATCQLVEQHDCDGA